MLSKEYDEAKDLWAEVTLQKMFKTDNWYNDKTAMLMTIRKGKGRKPYIDSTVYFNLRIQVDDKEVFSNFPKELSDTKNWEEESAFLD